MRYSYEFKRKCVEMYRQGLLPDTPNGISKEQFRREVRKWTRIEDAQGPDALKHKCSYKNWPPEEKLVLVSKVIAGESNKSVAFNVGISDGMLYQWVRKYKIYGYNGLIDKKKGRKSKDAMATRWNDEGENTDVYKDGNGLGWDYVESLAYEAEGVKVLGKGGEVTNQHAFLLVAPDEEVSVAVLSAGGSSSYNELMAEALLDVVLEEQGIAVSHENDQTYEFTDEVPEEYLAYEGFYAFSSFSGTSYAYVSFDNNMMRVKYIDFGSEMTEEYRFTSDGSFVSVDDNGMPTVDCKTGRFEANENGVYITVEMNKQVLGLGSKRYYQYAAERINPNPISEEAVASWQKYCERDMVIFNERYSSTDYDRPFLRVEMLDELPGYMYGVTGQGGRTLKIMDDMNVVSFTTMPCSSNRDLVDAQITNHTLSDGSEITEFKMSTGLNYRFVDELPVFNSDVTEVNLRNSEAQWFKIGEDMAESTIKVNSPENSAIYVYNKYHEVVYSTHMINSDGNIPLPSEGYIMFVGEDGGEICIK